MGSTPMVIDYVNLAKRWGDAMDAGDSALANALHDRIQSTFTRIVESGQEDVLFQDISNENDAVSFFAAAHLKERDASRAIPVFERLTKSKLPYVAVSARFILKELES